MLLHSDGSHHRGFQDERWYDRIVILDDATSEIYYAQLLPQELVGLLHARDAMQSQSLKQTSLPGSEVALAASRACGE
jgi:hypothetical protein